MNKILLPHVLLPLAALALVFATVSVDARTKPTRTGSAVVVPKPNGGGVASGSETTTGANGTVTRRGQAVSDGQGNVKGGTSAEGTTVNGGSASRAGKFQRNADGSFSQSSGASGTTASGGTGSTSGNVSGDGQGGFSGIRQTSGTSANGDTYSGQTTGGTGQGVQHGTNATTASGTNYDGSTSVSQDGATHSATCTNASGEVIACK
jgi:hypothetical protein